MRNRYRSICIAFGLAVPVISWSAESPLDPEQLYHDYCSVCHGERGDGVSRASKSLFPSPRDFSSESAKRELSRERMIFSVTYGRPNTAMAGWQRQLAEVQIEAVVDYVRMKFMGLDARAGMQTASEHDGNHAAGDHQHALPSGDLARYFADDYPVPLHANQANGEALYRHNCVPCHGDSGDGQGPRAYFILPKPRDFRHPAARVSLNRPHLFEAIAKGEVGSEMPAWEKVLSEQQIADISEYVIQRFIRPEELFQNRNTETSDDVHRREDGTHHQH